MITKATVGKLSICPCGFSILKDGIEIGTEYEVSPDVRCNDIDLICGGCGKRHKVETIWVWSKIPGIKGGFLPIDIFNLPKEMVVHNG